MKKIIAGILIGWLTLPALTAQRTTNEIPLTPIEYETCPYSRHGVCDQNRKHSPTIPQEPFAVF